MSTVQFRKARFGTRNDPIGVQRDNVTLTKARLGEFRGVGRNTSTTCIVWTTGHPPRPPSTKSLSPRLAQAAVPRRERGRVGTLWIDGVGYAIYQGPNDRSDALASGPRPQNVERGKSELPEFVAVCLLACMPSICISLCTVHRAAVDVHGGSTPTLVIINLLLLSLLS